MKLCDNDHPAIVYTEEKCPLCKALDDFNNSEAEAEELREQILNWKNTVDELEKSNERLVHRIETLEASEL